MSKLKVAAVAVAALGTMGAGGAASATPQDKVTICHATGSESNPYVKLKVDNSSVDEPNNEAFNGHGDHEGDIIPGVKNWTAAGKAIWENGCKVPSSTPSPTPTVTVTAPGPAVTATVTATATATETATATATATETATATAPGPTVTATTTTTATAAATATATATETAKVPGPTVTATAGVPGPTVTVTVSEPQLAKTGASVGALTIGLPLTVLGAALMLVAAWMKRPRGKHEA